MQSKLFNPVGSYVLLLMISLAVCKQLIVIHEPHLDFIGKVTSGVLIGTPAWLAYQNRLLGPAVVLMISKLGGTYVTALQIFFFVTVTTENFILYFLLKKTGNSSFASVRWVIVYSFLFIIFQDSHVYYTWDGIDAILFTLFAYFMLYNRNTFFLVILFLVALLNRESALFIALFLILDSLDFSGLRIRVVSNSIRNLVIGCLLLVFGVAFTKFIRSYLFVRTFDGSNDSIHQTFGNHFYFKENLQDLFIGNLGNIGIINSFYILCSIIFLGFTYKSLNNFQKNAIIIYCAVVLNIMLFGLINESRLYIILFPILIFIIRSIVSPPEEHSMII